MADTHDRATRSYNMSRIKSKNTKPELWVRKYLFSQGLRYRINVHSMPGSPDIVLAKYKTVVFINGCFWHGHAGCRYFVIPETRKDWWIEKINKNIERDNRANEALRSAGWNVITVWECQLKPKQRSETLADLAAKIKNNLWPVLYANYLSLYGSKCEINFSNNERIRHFI